MLAYLDHLALNGRPEHPLVTSAQVARFAVAAERLSNLSAMPDKPALGTPEQVSSVLPPIG